MHKNQIFWLLCWCILALIIAALFFMAFEYATERANLITELVKQGTHPLEAKCALRWC